MSAEETPPVPPYADGPSPSEATPERDVVPAPASTATTGLGRLLDWIWNRRERRPRALWRIAGQILLMIVLFAALALPGSRLLRGVPDAAFRQAAGGVFALVATLGSVALAARLLDRRSWREFGLQLDRAWWRDLAFGLTLGAALMSVCFFAQRWLGWIQVKSIWPHGESAGLWQGFGPPLALFLAVGIYEEMQSRGYLLRVLAEGWRSPRLGPAPALLLAALVTSGLFGLAHTGNNSATLRSTVSVTLAGLLLALPYVLSGRMAVSIGLHITWNFFQGPVYGFPVSGTHVGAKWVRLQQVGPESWTGGEFGPEAGWIGVLLMVMGLLACAAWARWTEGRLALCAALTDPPTPPATVATTLAPDVPRA